MRCLERKTTERRWDLPLRDFLDRCSLVRRFAGGQNMSVEEMLADGIIANRMENEAYEAWLARQVREVLTLQCEQDNWRESADGTVRVRKDQDIEQMFLSAADRRWLLDTFGQRADVQAVWRTVCEQQPLTLAA